MPNIPLSGEDFVEDTPQYRERVRVTRQSCDALARTLERMALAMGRMDELTRECHQQQELLLHEVTQLVASTAYDPPNSLLQSALHTIVEGVRGVEAHRELSLTTHMQDLLGGTLHAFRSRHLDPLPGLGERAQSAREDFLAATHRYMAKGGGRRDGLENIEQEANAVMRSRHAYLLRSREYAAALNLAQGGRNCELVEGFVACVCSRSSFFSNASRDLKGLEPVLSDISLHLSTLRAKQVRLEEGVERLLAAQRGPAQQLQQQHSLHPLTPPPPPGEVAGESTITLGGALSEGSLSTLHRPSITGSMPTRPLGQQDQLPISTTGKRGHLFRRCEGTLRVPWQREYVALRNHLLHAMPDDREGVIPIPPTPTTGLQVEEGSSAYSIDLRVCSVRASLPEGGGRHSTFALSLPHGSLVLQALNEVEAEAWVSAIQEAISKALSADLATDSPVVGSIRPRKLVPGGVIADALSEPVDPGQPNVLSVLRVPGNNKCADCGTSDQLEWAASNLGVVLCIKCSGAHRALGSHLSRIKSLTLDDWSAAGVGVMTRLGNQRVNALLEHSLHANQLVELVKPTGTASPEDRAQFVQAKYEHRDFLVVGGGAGGGEGQGGGGIAGGASTGPTPTNKGTGSPRRKGSPVLKGKGIHIREAPKAPGTPPDYPDLLRHVQAGDMVGVLDCLLQRVPIANPAVHGTQALHLALERRDLAMAELLLQWRADLHAVREPKGWTCLHQAVASGDVEVVTFLLDRKASLTHPDTKGRTPVDLAVELAHQHEGEEAVRIVTLLQLSRFSQEQEREGGRSMRSSHSRTFGIEDGVRECRSPTLSRTHSIRSTSVGSFESEVVPGGS